MRADLAQFYQVRIDDVWEGREDAWHVVVLAEQLVLNPHSRVFAIKGGTGELQGWDANTVVLARTHNLIAGLIAGLASGTDLESILIDYPRPEKKPPPEPQTLAELFSGGLEFFAH